tara:strand:+ start:46 stop:996 length:951 start_codon:yes stop_codon:yes gene_type:complete
MNVFLNSKLSHFLFSFMFTFLLLKKFIPTLKKFFPAFPSERGMHKIVKPSSGGISFILIYSILVIYQGFYLPLLSLPMALVGLIDDKFNIPKSARYLCQIISLIFIMVYLKVDSNNIINSFSEFGFIGYFLLLFIGTAIINFINFMDGIDGLICGSMIIIFFTLNSQIHYLLPIIGTLSAFLYFNWYPSKIFMGDTGSLFLGTFLVSLMYSSSGLIVNYKIICLCSPLFLDAIICILRRFINKKNIFKAHKSHLYQRLVSSGIKHSTVSIIYILSIALLSLFYLYSNTINLTIIALLIFFFGIFLDKKFAKRFDKT